MSSVKECEKRRGTAVWELREEIRKLRKECGKDTPNARSVVKLMASLDTARINLIEAHLTLVTKMNAQPDEPRFTEFMIPLMDAVEEVKTLAEDVTEAAGENGTPNSQVEGENLKRDHARLVLSIETQLVAFEGVIQTALTREQHEELKVGVEKLSDLLLGQRKEVCTNLEKAPPQEADRLKEI